MKGKITGIVIRTVFNNQGWAAPCKNPTKDYRCYKCVGGDIVSINGGNPIEQNDKGSCYGDFGSVFLPEDAWCWEQTLCTKYYWRNVKGKWRYANAGMPVYFVYTELDGSLTLWGQSTIDTVENDLEYPTLYFKPFKPLPENKWIKGLRGEDLTGSSWRQLFYRYLDEIHETYIRHSIAQGKKNLEVLRKPLPSRDGFNTLEVSIRKDIKEKLEKISHNEGRAVDEVIREAVAKLIRDRGF